MVRRRLLFGIVSADAEGEVGSSCGDSSSTLRWKTAFFCVPGALPVLVWRRRGSTPRETNAPGPRSSLKEERERRWPGRMAVVVDEEGSAGVAYGIVGRREEGGEDVRCTGKGI